MIVDEKFALGWTDKDCDEVAPVLFRSVMLLFDSSHDEQCG